MSHLKKIHYLILSFILLTTCVNAQSTEYIEEKNIPAEVKPFIENGIKPYLEIPTKVLALEKGDLNGDGKQDYILVLERTPDPKVDMELPRDQRPLILLIRQHDNTLKAVKRNNEIVYCSRCGRKMGNAFAGVTLKKKSFTVTNLIDGYGGSTEEWSIAYTFNYSHKDQIWKFVKTEMTTFDKSKPGKIKNEMFKPSKYFRKIDISDFDPNRW